MNEAIYQVDEEYNGIRIDKYLSIFLEDRSRSYLQGIIEQGNVMVNKKNVKSNYKLKTLDEIIVEMPITTDIKAEAEEIILDILYEDDDILVVNKPKGMVVHPATGNYSGTLVNALLYHCKSLSTINGPLRPGIVHRIDKDTTGVLLVAKNDEAHNFLAKQLQEHSMKREYYALFEGILGKDKGTIDKPLARCKNDRLKIGIVEGGRYAVTHYEVIEKFKSTTLVKCILETGRTHQIRVHMASIGHPLVGDQLYSFKKHKHKIEGQMLHAKVLGFIHPRTKEYMEFHSELPSNFKELLVNLSKELI